MKKIFVTVLSLIGLTTVALFAVQAPEPLTAIQVLDLMINKGGRVTITEIVTDRKDQHWGKCQVTVILEGLDALPTGIPYTRLAEWLGIKSGNLAGTVGRIWRNKGIFEATFYFPPEFCNGLPAINPIPVPAIPPSVPKLNPIVMGLVLLGFLLGVFRLFPRLVRVRI